MKTLGKTQTITFYNDSEGFNQLEKAWRVALSEGFKPSTNDLLLYTIVRGKNWMKMFTPITNQVKLDNGQRRYGAASDALSELIHSYSWAYKGPEWMTQLLVPDWKEKIKDFVSFDLQSPYKELVNA